MLPPNSAARTQPYAFMAVALLAFLISVSFSPRSQAAATVSTVYSFSPNVNDDAINGSAPNGGLVLDGAGNLYGTTQYGGSADKGTVFKLSPSGNLSPMRTFVGGNGETPNDGLVMDGDGNLYGTTQAGGISPSCNPNPCEGTVFKIDASGTQTTLHTFTGISGTVADGAMPNGGLVLKDGNLYGTTQYGGDNGDGIIFKISTTDPYTVTILHTFDGIDDNDGSIPNGGLVLGSDGKLYGTDQGGGPDAAGTLFMITTDFPYTFTQLYPFPKGDGTYPNGLIPNGGLAQDSSGALYGTTQLGGKDMNGTVFKFTPSSATLSTLYAFNGDTDGSTPNGGLAPDSDGNFYGTTQTGGSPDCGCGTVFKIIPPSVLTPGGLVTVHAFAGDSDGDTPNGGLVRGSDGNSFYGTTQNGGVDANGEVIGLGNIFKLDVSTPPASSPPPSGSGGGGGGGSLGLLTLAFLSAIYMLRKNQLRPAVLRRRG